MNMSSTIQRSLVLEAVKVSRCHVTADEVYDTIVNKHPHISRGTVYRNLNLLSDIGEIRKVEMPSGADRFDHLCHEHYATQWHDIISTSNPAKSTMCTYGSIKTPRKYIIII